MKADDIEYVCGIIAGLSGLPVRVFDGEKQTFFSSVSALPKDPMNIYKEEIFSIKKNVGYYVTPQFAYYGVVRYGEKRIVMGPTSRVRATDAELRELAFLADVPAEDTDDFLLGMKGIIPMPPESVMQIQCVMNYLLNGEKLSLSDISIYDKTQESITAQMTRDEEPRGEYEKTDLHNTVSLERADEHCGQRRHGSAERMDSFGTAHTRRNGGVRHASPTAKYVHRLRHACLPRGNKRRT